MKSNSASGLSIYLYRILTVSGTGDRVYAEEGISDLDCVRWGLWIGIVRKAGWWLWSRVLLLAYWRWKMYERRDNNRGFEAYSLLIYLFTLLLRRYWAIG